jgi:protein-S-isoprenylcysteine O-methyltransferase Ste14
MIPALAWPLLTVLVLPIGWVEYRILQKTRWGILLALLTVAALYGPWLLAIRGSPHLFELGLHTLVGLGLVLIALYLWVAAAPLILRDRGQVMTIPERLVTEGPYRWTRHPLYVGHALFIGGGVLASGALEVFLVIPLLWVIAAVASRYEEVSRLEPLFRETFRQYQSRTPFLLPLWAWLLWSILYGAVAVRLMVFTLFTGPFIL